MLRLFSPLPINITITLFDYYFHCRYGHYTLTPFTLRHYAFDTHYDFSDYAADLMIEIATILSPPLLCYAYAAMLLFRCHADIFAGFFDAIILMIFAISPCHIFAFHMLIRRCRLLLMPAILFARYAITLIC